PGRWSGVPVLIAGYGAHGQTAGGLWRALVPRSRQQGREELDQAGADGWPLPLRHRRQTSLDRQLGGLMRKPNANTYALFPIAWLLVSGAGCLAGTVAEPGSFARNFMVYGLGAGAIVASL